MTDHTTSTPIYPETSRLRMGQPIHTKDTENSVRGERALWRAVITQALMDASSMSIKPENQFHKFEARRWLTGNSKDFITVCDYAGLDPDYVWRMAKRALLLSCKWRTEAGKGKRYKPTRANKKKNMAPDELPAGAIILPFAQPA